MKTKPKSSYRIRNWQEYDGALKQRGSITFWVSEEVVAQWRNEQKTGRKGASNYYSDERNHDDGDTQISVWVSLKTDRRVFRVIVYPHGN